LICAVAFVVALFAIRAANLIIPQKWIFAYNNFVRRIFTTLVPAPHLPWAQVPGSAGRDTEDTKFFLCEHRDVSALSVRFVVKLKENAMRRMFGFMIGIVVGALIGSAVALLLAPETGDKFRSEIRARGEVLVNDVRHAATARRIELTEQLESMRAPRES